MMTKRVLRVLLGIGMGLAIAPGAQAQATRTWVSGLGSDVNPCSRSAPCLTFAGAITKTASGGFINVLDSGGFNVVTITKSITIDGEGAHAGILAPAGVTAITINARGATVVLRNLVIESSSVKPGVNGIRVFDAAAVHIEKVWIGNFSGAALNFAPAGFADGSVSDTTIVNNGRGIEVRSGRVVVNRLHADRNDIGVAVRGPAAVTVRDSYAMGGSTGFSANTHAAAIIRLENCTSTGNKVGIDAGLGATVQVSNSMIAGNAVGLLNDSASSIISLGGNSLVDNPTPGSFAKTINKQ